MRAVILLPLATAFSFLLCHAWAGDSDTRQPAVAGTNLLGADGDFEQPIHHEGEESFSGRWRRFPIDGITRSHMRVVRSHKRGGRNSQQIAVTRLMNGAPRLSIPIPGGITAGTDYEATAWVLSEKREARVKLLVHNGHHWFPSTHVAIDREIGKQWRPVVLRFRADKDDPQALLGISVDEENTIWVDDVSFCVGLSQPITARPMAGGIREWTDSTGSHRTVGRVEAIEGQSIILRKASGTTARVPFDRLSIEDRGLLDSLSAEHRSELYRRHVSGEHNLIHNSSFELPGSGWHADGVQTERISDAAVPHGSHCVVVKWNGIPDGSLQSVGFEMPWKSPHTLSFSVRGSAAGLPVTASICSAPNTVVATIQVSTAAAWSRHELSFSAPPTPDGVFFISIVPPPSGSIALDAIQLEAGTAARRFEPAAVIEAGLRITQERTSEAAVFAPGDRVRAVLSLFNNGKACFLRLQRRVCDLWGRPQPGTVVDWLEKVPPGPSEIPIVAWADAAATGAFRGECDVMMPAAALQDAEPARQFYAEALFAVLPPVTGTSSLGTTLDYNISGSRLYRRAGYGWTKTWWLDWERAQPSSDTAFAFTAQQDQRIDDWTAAGLTPLGILGHAPRWAQVFEPKWGWANPRDPSGQERYAADAVLHFASRVPLWELQNEPNQEVQAVKGETRAQAYAREAMALARGAWAADPTIKLLLGSLTVRDEFGAFFDEIFRSQPGLKERRPDGGMPHLYGVSFHFYTADPAPIRRTVADIRATLQRHNLESLRIWDTEWAPTGTIRSLKRAELRGPTRWSVSPRRAAALAFEGFVSRLGEGVEAAILYDTYNTGDMGDATFRMMLDLDGNLTTIAATVAALAHNLTGIVDHEALSVENAWVYRFHCVDGRTVVCGWSDDRIAQGATVPLTAPEDGSILDMMGNITGGIKAGEAVQLGTDPIMIVSDSRH